MVTVLCELKDNIYWLTLNRPQNVNAINLQMVSDLHNILDQVEQDSNARALVITGSGDIFCGGADLQWMLTSMELTKEENYKDALQLAQLLDKLNSLSVTTIAKVNGACMGGGLGIISCCDIVVASTASKYSFTELLLGLIPSTILPYVINVVGIKQAKQLMLTASLMDVEYALRLGFVHQLVDKDNLDTCVNEILDRVFLTAPTSARFLKSLFISKQKLTVEEIELSAKHLADIRSTPEAQQGIQAFLSHKKPAWAIKSE